MSNLEDKIVDTNNNDIEIEVEVETEDNLTVEEQQKIDTIQHETFIKPLQLKKQPKSFNIWSIFGLNFNPTDLLTATGTQVDKPFNFQNALYLDKSVIINNISGKNAYVILTPCPITTVSSFGIGSGFAGIEASIDASLDTKGEYKAQKVSISNNTSSRCELDNTKFYCTLYINDNEQWKKSWDNRKFNGKKFNINILEKHAIAALSENNIPNF